MLLNSNTFFPSLFNSVSVSSWLVFLVNMAVMASIIGIVSTSLFIALWSGSYRPQNLDNIFLEKVWTFVPVSIVTFLAVPSILVLYEQNSFSFSSESAKIIGHQWYWEYEMDSDCCLCADGTGTMNTLIGTESFPLGEYDLGLGEARWASTDSRLVLPAMEGVSLICTSEDVIHNFNLKSASVSVDCVPGRLSSHAFFSNLTGIMTGLCSELCGVGHSHMPCEVESIIFGDFTHGFLLEQQ